MVSLNTCWRISVQFSFNLQFPSSGQESSRSVFTINGNENVLMLHGDLHVSWWNPRKPLGTIDDVQNTIARGTTRIGHNTDQSRIVMNNPKLSKVHVIIEAKKDGITVQDKGSKGCKVWARRLKPGIGYNLEYRQSLCLGGVVLAHFQALGRMWRTTQRTLFQRLLRLWNTQVLQW